MGSQEILKLSVVGLPLGQLLKNTVGTCPSGKWQTCDCMCRMKNQSEIKDVLPSEHEKTYYVLYLAECSGWFNSETLMLDSWGISQSLEGQMMPRKLTDEAGPWIL